MEKIKTNEVLLKNNTQWLHFTKPQQIIAAQNLDDVVFALREVERLVETNKLYAAGFISYEAAPALDTAHRVSSTLLDGHSSLRSNFPLLWFGLYPAPRLITLSKPASQKSALSWLPSVDSDAYNAAIKQIKSQIAEGRTYQVNYTMRLKTDFNTDPWNFFLHLVQSQNDHAAYIDTGSHVICSASPELFFQLDGESITCKPMKGTTHRGRTTLEDQEQAQWLRESEKNRAENVMIVDMIRNDLGRIAKVGSVHVLELFTTEKYQTLWQMTSTVTAKTDASLTEIFAALFPCASITGAPKVSTMRIISELEKTPRNIYTGSIGYVAPNRKAKFNVAIRTALIDRESQSAEYGVGSGIVWDSVGMDEYTESLLKARILTEASPPFSLFETMLWTLEEGFFLREKHIARLLDSAEYFDFPLFPPPRWPSGPERSGAETKGVSRQPVTRETIGAYLDEISFQFTSPQRVRLLLDKSGILSHESKTFQPSDNHPPMRVCLAKEPIHSRNIFLFHKTTHREVYESARKDFPECDDILLYNEHNELTEFTIGNLVIEMDGELFTPPISCGLLAGTFRTHLLETSQVKERIIRVDKLKNCSQIFLVNSVRKWQKVEI